MKRRRRRNPESSYLVNFALAASAVVALLYLGKRFASRDAVDHFRPQVTP